MRTKRLVWLMAVLLLACLANLVAGKSWPIIFAVRQGLSYSSLVPLGDALEEIERNYVDEVSSGKLVRGAIRGMVEGLGDPQSSFFEPADYDRLQENTQGEFGGLGILIGLKEGRITVIQPIEGKPAARAGVKEGDSIVAIDGQKTQGIPIEEAAERLKQGMDAAAVGGMLGITLSEAVNKLRGPVGTSVKMTLEREGAKSFDVTLVREKIELESVTGTKIIEDSIGYMRITDFATDTPGAVDKALSELEGKGIGSLILDLRNNPGGLLDTAVQVADIFLDEGQTIVYARGRGARIAFSRAATGRYRHARVPLVVLINEVSASGAEIVAGAIQDWKRGILLGAKSFGKGSVQNIVRLSDGSALRITTARYYAPKGRVIDGKGLDPDILVPSAIPLLEGKRAKGEHPVPLHGAVPEKPSPTEKPSPVEKPSPEEKPVGPEKPEEAHPDVQLERAVELLKTYQTFQGLLGGSKENQPKA